MDVEPGRVQGKVIARAWFDSTFKAELLADPRAALGGLGGTLPEWLAITVLEDTPETTHVVMPPDCRRGCYFPCGELSCDQAEAPEADGPAVKPVGLGQLAAQVVDRIRAEPGSRGRLLSDTEGVLASLGIAVPEGVTVRVVANDRDRWFLVLPDPPAEGSLDSEDLDGVAGGY